MAKTKQQLKVENNTQFPNNNTGFISPDKLRTFNVDMIDSLVDVISYNAYTASVTATSASFDARIDVLEGLSGSLSGSNAALSASVASLSASVLILNNYTSSVDDRLDSLEAFTGSYNAFSASVDVQFAVYDEEIYNLNVHSQSLNNFTSSFNTYTASQALLNGTFATTGSNIFKAGQTISGSVILRSGDSFAFPTGSMTSDASRMILSQSAEIRLNTARIFTEGTLVAARDSNFGVDAGTKVHMTGSVGISGSLQLSGSFKNNSITYPLTDGVADQFMETDGNGNLVFDWVKTLHQNIRNRETTAIVRGTPLFISGSTGDNADVYFANAANPLRRPATLIAYDATLAAGATGTAIISGEIQGVDTNLYAEGTIIYLAAGGGWTPTRPTGSAIVQPLGIITRKAVNGRGIIFNQLENDLPNLTSGSAWVGNASSVPTATLTSSLALNTIGNAVFSGSLTITGSLNGNVVSQSITSLTASLNTDIANYFVIQYPAAATNLFLDITGSRFGQEIDVLLTQGINGLGTITFPTTFKFVEGQVFQTTPKKNAEDLLTLQIMNNRNKINVKAYPDMDFTYPSYSNMVAQNGLVWEAPTITEIYITNLS